MLSNYKNVSSSLWQGATSLSHRQNVKIFFCKLFRVHFVTKTYFQSSMKFLIFFSGNIMIHDLQYFQLDKTSIQNFWIIKQTGFKNKKKLFKENTNVSIATYRYPIWESFIRWSIVNVAEPKPPFFSWGGFFSWNRNWFPG